MTTGEAFDRSLVELKAQPLTQQNVDRVGELMALHMLPSDQRCMARKLRAAATANPGLELGELYGQ